MELSPILPSPVTRTVSDASTDQSAATADFESFLTLLTAQLRNQDPLSPLDATEFVAQLASFSTVEQLVSSNEQLESISDQLLSGTIASFGSWIGRDVAVQNGSFRYAGQPIRFEYEAASDNQTVVGSVKMPDGTVFAQFQLDGSGAGEWTGPENTPLNTDLIMEVETFIDGVSQGVAPASVFRKVSGLEGTTNGFALRLEDGGSVAADQVVKLQDGAAI